MIRLRYPILVFVFGLVFSPAITYAQVPEDFVSDRLIRVVGAGELADSISVWGDVGSPGRYLVPMETNLAELISFSFGYAADQNNGQVIWGKTQMRIKVSRYNQNRRLVEIASFKYKYRKPEPVELFEFDLQNNDVVTIQVRRRPSLVDYINVVAPVVGVIATSVLLIENLRGN